MIPQDTTATAVDQQRLVRELYDTLAFVLPLAWAIAEDGGEPKWRRERAQQSIGKIDAAMVAADSLPNYQAQPP